MWKVIWQFIKAMFEGKDAEVTAIAKPEPLPVVEPAKEETIGLTAALSWELPCNDGQANQGNHPERKAWSEHLFNELNKNYDLLMTAKDIKEIIPNFDKRTRSERLTALAELMSTAAEYESTWNPNGFSKDVNGSSEPGLMARGLFQMNADADQKNYRTGTKYKYQDLHNPLINIEVAVKILVTVLKVRGKITFRKGETSPILGYFYATLLIDGKTGVKVLKSAKKRIATALGEKAEEKPVPAKPSKAFWKKEGEKHKGKTEHNSIFAKFLSSFWDIVGLLGYKKAGKIAGTTYAWCGLFVAAMLQISGVEWQKDGAAAVNWLKYGQKIEWKINGIPEGAILQLNHKGQSNCGNSGSNHVTFSEGDCTAEDLLKKDATIDAFGGNQADTVKVSTYSVKEICGVRWPRKLLSGEILSLPPKVLVSRNCSSKFSKEESTR
jgi:hypothetical protein